VGRPCRKKLEGGDEGVEGAAALDLCGVIAAAGAVKVETGLGVEVTEDQEVLAAIRPNEVKEEWRQGARDFEYRWGMYDKGPHTKEKSKAKRT
jgi:hypothetical protein